MVELLLQRQKVDSPDWDCSDLDETGGRIYSRIIDNKFVICPENCIAYLRHYYLDELLYKQEIETLLIKREKIKILNTLFNNELKNNKSYIKIEEDKLKTIFIKVTNYIIDVAYKDISLEFTPDSSIFFNILLNDTCKTHIEIYLTEENENYDSAFFHIIKKKESILSGYGKLANITKELNENV